MKVTILVIALAAISTYTFGDEGPTSTNSAGTRVECAPEDEDEVDSPPGMLPCRVLGITSANQVERSTMFVLAGYLDAADVRWLLSDRVRRELDISDMQARDVKGIASELAQLRSSLIEIGKLQADGQEDRLRSALDSFADRRKKAHERIDGVLDQAQKSRLFELKQRQSAAEVGLEKAFHTVWSDHLTLTQQELDRISESMKGLRERLAERRKQQQKTLLRTVNHVLTLSQRSELERVVGSTEKYFAPSMEWLLWQLEQRNC